MAASSVGSPVRSGRDAPLTTIRPATGWTPPRVAAAWREREILYYFVRRDVKVRYAQTALGVLWTIFQPIGMMLVFTFAFRNIGHVQSEGISYPVFVFTGLVFWTFFSRAMTAGAESLSTNGALLTKTALPRLLLPVGSVISALFDFLVTFVVLLAFAAVSGYYPTWRFAFVPIVMLVALILTIGLVVLAAAVNVEFRDVRNALPLLLQMLLFACPVVYSFATLSEKWQRILSIINPLVGVIEGFRWSVLGTSPPSTAAVVSSLCFGVGFFVVGGIYFGRVERRFADVA